MPLTASDAIRARGATRTSKSRWPTSWKMPGPSAPAAVKGTNRIVAIGTRKRRSTPVAQRAHEVIKSGPFGDIVSVEMTFNVNQPARLATLPQTCVPAAWNPIRTGKGF